VEKPPLRTAATHIHKWAQHLPALTTKLFQEVIAFIYPPACAGCGQPSSLEVDEAFCPACWQDLNLIREPYCPVCGIPFPVETPGLHICGDCLVDSYRFDRARAMGLYRGLLRDVLHRFKYGGQTFLVRPLAKLLTGPGKELSRLHKIELIVPVPLHSKRLLQRGFNQAALLARRLGSVLRISVDYSSLKRTRWTEPQTGLSRNQRAKNVKGAFKLTDPEKVRGKSVLLLDDVLTTGETVNQCVHVLKKDGEAGEVVVLTVARTVGL
jgi:ComF family protein